MRDELDYLYIYRMRRFSLFEGLIFLDRALSVAIRTVVFRIWLDRRSALRIDRPVKPENFESNVKVYALYFFAFEL